MTPPREIIERNQTARIKHVDDCSRGLMLGDGTCYVAGRGKCQGYNCPDGFYKPKQ